jgi:hypothetical protein
LVPLQLPWPLQPFPPLQPFMPLQEFFSIFLSALLASFVRPLAKSGDAANVAPTMPAMAAANSLDVLFIVHLYVDLNRLSLCVATLLIRLVTGAGYTFR